MVGLNSVLNARTDAANRQLGGAGQRTVTVVDATHRVAFGEFSPADAVKSLEAARTQIGDSWAATLKTSEGFVDGEAEAFASVIATKDAAADDWRALIRYDYAQGATLAATLKAQVLLATAGARRVSAKSGRSQRPIQIKMDTVI